jgi:hypothetical protein
MRFHVPLWTVLTITFAISTVASAEGVATLTDMEGGGIRYRSMVGDMDQASFRRLAVDFLSAPTVKLGVIVLFGSPQDSALAGPRQQDHCTYDNWRALVETHTRSDECPAVQEAIKIGSRIAVRRVDRTCRRSTTVLAGDGSPLDLVVTGKRYEVLEVSFSRPIGERNSGRISANLYLRAPSGVSTGTAHTVTTHIRHLTNASYLGVRIRPDAWFVPDCGFPADYPFDNRGKLPTKEAVEAVKTAACFVSGAWPIRCFQGTGRP